MLSVYLSVEPSGVETTIIKTPRSSVGASSFCVTWYKTKDTIIITIEKIKTFLGIHFF